MITVCDFASFRSDLLHFLDIAAYYFYQPFFGPNMTHYWAVFRPLQGFLAKSPRGVGLFSRLASADKTEKKPHP